ncbi:hypothetical protein ACR820_00325 [Streptomyces netropsis]
MEKVVGAGLEIPGFSMLDRAAVWIRAEVNGSLFARLHERMDAGGSQRMAALLDNRLSDGTTEHNCLKKPAKSPTWSHFRQQKEPRTPPFARSAASFTPCNSCGIWRTRRCAGG